MAENPEKSEIQKEAEAKLNKFEFDTDFFEISVGQDHSAARAPRTMQEAEQRGYDRGVIEGQQQAEALAQNKDQQYTQTLQQALIQAQQAQDLFCEQLQKQMLGLMRTSLTMLTSNLAERFPDEMLDNHLRQALHQARKEQHVTLYLSPAARELHQKLQQDALTLEGVQLTITTNPQLAATDCTLEWATGGVEAKFKDILQAFDAELEALGAGTAPPAPLKEKKAASEKEEPANQQAEPTPAVEEQPAQEETATATTEEPPKEEKDPHQQKVEALLGDDDLIDELKSE